MISLQRLYDEIDSLGMLIKKSPYFKLGLNIKKKMHTGKIHPW